MAEKKFYEEFEKYYATFPDCVSSGIEAYKQELTEIFDLTNGQLVLNNFEGTQDSNRNYTLNLTINNKEYTYVFKGSEYFNQDLIQEFNKIIEHENPNEKRRLIEIGDGIDIDFGLAFIERIKEFELAKQGKIWRSEDWLNNFK